MPVNKHPLFLSPPPDAHIWRYMDVAKYLSLLESQALFFARADLLGDPFEGSWPRKNVEARIPYFQSLGLPGANPHEIAQAFANYSKLNRQFSFVNCWHVNPNESMAMWRIYAQIGAGIAIRSTFQNLLQNLERASQKIYVGIVRYLDYQNDVAPDWTPIAPLIVKRASFAHENELRAVFSLDIPGQARHEWEKASPPDKPGILVPVNLLSLVERVYVAPQSPAWIAALVEGISNKLGLKVQVHHSSIDTDPVF
jgi:hypothetical protein